MKSGEYADFLDEARKVWDPTEGQHRLHGQRSVEQLSTLEVHWIGTGKALDEGDTATELLSFERYHEITKGWTDLFYNTAVDGTGRTFAGRDITVASQSNLLTVWTLLVVAGEDDWPTPDQELFIARRIWQAWGLIDPARKTKSLRGHKERPAVTTCPGPWITTILDRLRGGWNPSFDWAALEGLGSPEPEQPKAKDPLTKFEKEYAEAVAAGITDGSRPDETATRREVAVMVNRALNIATTGETK